MKVGKFPGSGSEPLKELPAGSLLPHKFIGCVGVMAVLALWPVVGAPRVNDYRLWKVERSFRAIDHPPGTKLIKRLREVGLLIGNSNHCDYFVGELRSYTGRPEAIAAAYRSAKVWNPLPDGGEIRVVFLKDGQIPEEERFETPYKLREMKEWGDVPAKGKMYFVYFLAAGQDPGLDLRCH